MGRESFLEHALACRCAHKEAALKSGPFRLLISDAFPHGTACFHQPLYLTEKYPALRVVHRMAHARRTSRWLARTWSRLRWGKSWRARPDSNRRQPA